MASAWNLGSHWFRCFMWRYGSLHWSGCANLAIKVCRLVRFQTVICRCDFGAFWRFFGPGLDLRDFWLKQLWRNKEILWNIILTFNLSCGDRSGFLNIRYPKYRLFSLQKIKCWWFLDSLGPNSWDFASNPITEVRKIVAWDGLGNSLKCRGRQCSAAPTLRGAGGEVNTLNSLGF